jgi:hypothetical protein
MSHYEIWTTKITIFQNIILNDEVEDKLHDVKIKPTIQATQSTEKKNNK